MKEEEKLYNDVIERLAEVLAAQPLSYEQSIKTLAALTGWALGSMEADMENEGKSKDEAQAAVTSGMLLFVVTAGETQALVYDARRKKRRAKKPNKRDVLKAVEEMLRQ